MPISYIKCKSIVYDAKIVIPSFFNKILINTHNISPTDKKMAILGNTLLYQGCVIKHKAKHLKENYEKLLKELGVSFITIDELPCCGMPMLYGGYKEDFLEHQERLLELLEQKNVKKIITPCPACARIFKDEYNLKAEHISQTLHDNLRKIHQKSNGEKISYHDPCELGRKMGVVEEPRAVLKKAGYDIDEFDENKEDAMCCGAGGLLKANSPRAASRIAELRLKQAKSKKIVTSCPMCYLHLKENAGDKEVLEMSEVLL